MFLTEMKIFSLLVSIILYYSLQIVPTTYPTPSFRQDKHVMPKEYKNISFRQQFL